MIRNIFQWVILTVLSFSVGAAGVSSYLLYTQPTNGRLAFTNELAIPPILEPAVDDNGRKTFTLTAEAGTQQFFPGLNTPTWGFNGAYLGPTIRVQRGDEVIFNVTNQLNRPTTVHWHGLHVPAVMDGTPHQPIMAGGTWQSSYTIKNEAATMWYHPHPHMETGRQVYQGLAGMYIIDDDNPAAQNLPHNYGVDDIPIILQDRLFDQAGQMVYEPNDSVMYGDTLLVNGTYNPFVNVEAKLIRLRLLNGSNGRIYNLGLSNNRPFVQIASDGGLLERPLNMRRLLLAPGERAEIVIDLSDGRDVLLQSFPPDDLPTLLAMLYYGAGSGRFDVLRLNIQPAVTPSSPLPQQLNTIDRFSRTEIDHVRQFDLGAANPLTDLNINGRLMNMMQINEVVHINDVERWQIRNLTGRPHPFHIHDTQFLVLDRDGRLPPPNERGWKDTVLIHPGETVNLVMQFTEYADPTVPYMYHCHILEHEDAGMMGQFVVIDEP
ncbi:MAG: multicopper oxidase domain-containing protein [Anaerolineales bacterium]|nr:multicopper oxidase domain-containing protein [Anaerolineales bacterium]